MLRPLYRWVLRLHPAGFRTRFADEMLSIFDHTTGITATVRLLVDGLISLLRQWTLRPEFRHEFSPLPTSCRRPDPWPRALDRVLLHDLLRHTIQLDPRSSLAHSGSRV